MKKARGTSAEAPDEMRPEYRFDYATARPNPYAARLGGQVLAVVLDPDVAAAFPTAESVNDALRSVMGVVRRRSTSRPPKKAKVRRRALRPK